MLRFTRMSEASGSAPAWLLLVHQLPAHPSNLRVHIWRRLQQVGAVSLRNSLYVLPDVPEAREDFDWIRAEIVSRGGQVSVLAAAAVDGYTDDELREAFRAARAAEFDALIHEIGLLAKRAGQRGRRPARDAVRRDVAKLRERLQALNARDYFRSPRAADAHRAMEQLESQLASEPSSATTERLDPRFFKRRVWLTRPRPGIDRMASAWLIRRFVAADATFAFGSLPAVDGQLPFDMPDVEFGHQDSDCTYETLVRRFGIADAAAVRIGHIVHDLDLKEARYGLPETATIGRLVEGLRDAGTSDHETLERGMAMIEALYRSFAREGQRPVTPNKRVPARPATPRRRRS
jgi:hypothetical protein